MTLGEGLEQVARSTTETGASCTGGWAPANYKRDDRKAPAIRGTGLIQIAPFPQEDKSPQTRELTFME